MDIALRLLCLRADGMGTMDWQRHRNRPITNQHRGRLDHAVHQREQEFQQLQRQVLQVDGRYHGGGNIQWSPNEDGGTWRERELPRHLRRQRTQADGQL